RFGRARRSPDQRLDARQQLREGERLDEIVVAAALQTANAIVDRSSGAQNEHGNDDLSRAQLLDERQPVTLRQHQVDNPDVVRLVEGVGEAGPAARRPVERKPGLAQARSHEIRNGVVVLDEQRAHLDRSYLARRSGVSAGAARRYCTGQDAEWPSVWAECSGQYGSRSSCRAIRTQSAFPLRTILSACCGSVMSPTAPVAIDASLRMRWANGTW